MSFVLLNLRKRRQREREPAREKGEKKKKMESERESVCVREKRERRRGRARRQKHARPGLAPTKHTLSNQNHNISTIRNFMLTIGAATSENIRNFILSARRSMRQTGIRDGLTNNRE